MKSNTYGAGSLLDGFHGIFDLKEMAIGREYGEGCSGMA
jgi:hypothetical protein